MSDFTASARPIATSERSAAGSAATRASGSRSLPMMASASRRRLVRTCAPGDQAEARARIAGLERDVLGDRHPVDEAEILMDEGDRQRVDARVDGVGRRSRISPASAG